MSTEGSTKAIIAALLANLGIAVTKLVAWLLTGFSSLLAESIHSLADSGNQALLLVGSRRAKRPATDNHPFGFGRERYVYAFIVSIVLFTVGGVFALYEAYHKYHELHDGLAEDVSASQWRLVPIVVLVAAIAMESFSFRTAIVESNHVRGKATWIAFIRNAKAPELPVVLLEDFAALIGLMMALFGVTLTLLTDNGYWDVAGTAGIGVLLIVVAVILAVETKSLLLGEAAHEDKRDLIEAALLHGGRVSEILHMRTLHVGPEQILVAVKIAVVPTDSAQVVADTINEAELRIRAAVPEAIFIFIEPDIKTNPGTPPREPSHTP